MAELWELICHHTYRGIPGVVVDLSPCAASHGQAFGLDDSDFLADGIATGSGSVRFYKQGGRIRVPAEAIPWQSIVGVKGEVTLRRQPSMGFIIDSDAFQFHIRGNTFDSPVAWFSSYPTQYSEISSAFDPVGPQPYRVPNGQWVTLGFMHDGFGTMELYADGQVVARRTGVYAPVNAPGGAGLSIGNALHSGGLSCNGEIDDVKIWRLNPRRFDDEFYSRPMDRETAECWMRFRREIDDAFRRHPDCAKQIGSAVKNAVDRPDPSGDRQGPETQKRARDAPQGIQSLVARGARSTAPRWWTCSWTSLAGCGSPASLRIAPSARPLRNSACLK